MKHIASIILFLMIFYSMFSCSVEEEKQVSVFCDKLAVVDKNAFQNRPDHDGTGRNSFEIVNAEIENDCLSITIKSGGCNNGTWKVDLVDADRISETAIPQRDVKVFLENTEPCNAITAMTISFELTPLRISDKEIILNLEKWDFQLKYSY